MGINDYTLHLTAEKIGKARKTINNVIAQAQDGVTTFSDSGILMEILLFDLEIEPVKD